MWVFNEYELIKLATLNYNLIPAGVPLWFLAWDYILLLCCLNLLGSHVPAIKSERVFHPTLLCFDEEQKKPFLEIPPFQVAGPAAGMCHSATPTALPPRSLLASICFPVSGLTQCRDLSGADRGSLV